MRIFLSIVRGIYRFSAVGMIAYSKWKHKHEYKPKQGWSICKCKPKNKTTTENNNNNNNNETHHTLIEAKRNKLDKTIQNKAKQYEQQQYERGKHTNNEGLDLNDFRWRFLSNCVNAPGYCSWLLHFWVYKAENYSFCLGLVRQMLNVHHVTETDEQKVSLKWPKDWLDVKQH